MKLRFALVLLASCSPGSTTPDASTDGATNDATVDAASDVTSQQDSATDAAVDVVQDAAFDAGACSLAPVDGGTCNALTATGSAVTPTCVNTAPPVAGGGAIYNGHYVLTSIEYFNNVGQCPTETQKIDWSICGGDWETVQVSGAQAAFHVNANVTVQKSALVIQLVCPNSGTSNWGYDATSSGIVFYLYTATGDGGTMTRVDTYTRM